MNVNILLTKIGFLIFSILISILFFYQINNGFRKNDYLLIPVFALILFLIIENSVRIIQEKNMQYSSIENFAQKEPMPKSKKKSSQPAPVGPKPKSIPPISPAPTSFIADEELSGPSPIDRVFHEPIKQRKPPMSDTYIGPQQIKGPPFKKKVDGDIDKIQQGFDAMDESNLDENEKVSYPKPPSKKYEDKKLKQVVRKEKVRPDISTHSFDDGKGNANRNENSNQPININVSYNNNPNAPSGPSVNNIPVNLPTQQDSMNNLASQFGDLLKLAGIANIGKLLFDSGMEQNKKQENCMTPGSSMVSPVNPVTQNAALSNLNQSYYPAYLENPLNKREPGTHIESVFDKNENIKKEIQKNKEDNRDILFRKGNLTVSSEKPKESVPKNESKQGSSKPKPPVSQSEDEKNNSWMKSNYEVTMLKKILSERNDPAPVLLENPWSEWAPVN